MNGDSPKRESPLAEETRCGDCGNPESQCICYDDPDEEWACTFCGGEGYAESDDPLWDDVDEFGMTDCSACGGTGLRKHQTVF